jgi:G3E family GTPase
VRLLIGEKDENNGKRILAKANCMQEQIKASGRILVWKTDLVKSNGGCGGEREIKREEINKIEG